MFVGVANARLLNRKIDSLMESQFLVFGALFFLKNGFEDIMLSEIN